MLLISNPRYTYSSSLFFLAPPTIWYWGSWLILQTPWACSSSSTAWIMGHIMAVHAAFEIHMDRNMVTIINPKCNLTWNK